MKKVVFSSIDGGQSHRELILTQIFDLHMQARATQNKIEVQIMCFAFTDEEIGDALLHLIQQCPNVEVRMIADWSQGAPNSPSVVRHLASNGGSRIKLKLKLDLPYYADKDSGRVRWGYHTSHGMLHHKTMLVINSGTPERLISGSFNWGARGTRSYENTMLMHRAPDTEMVLDAFEAEFKALWTSKSMTANAQQAAELALAARKKVQAGGSVHDLNDLQDILADRFEPDQLRSETHLIDGNVLPAFSGRHLTSLNAHYGFAKSNNARNLNLLRPSGSRKPAPCSVNAVALEAIRSVPDGDPIKIAMYAMSPRVPEYSALLDAARRGCPLKILLDRKIGNDVGESIAAKAKAEKLPIEVRATNKRMHQKYILAPKANMVVTGTANMTVDSAQRHAEHRILFRDDAPLSFAFNNDFNVIWGRIR